MQKNLPSTTHPLLFQAAFAISSKVQAPVSLVLTSVLQAAAVAVQDLCNVQPPSGGESPVNIYSMVIAASGERKTSTTKLTNIGIERFEEEMAIDCGRQKIRNAAKKILLKGKIRSTKKLLEAALEDGYEAEAKKLSEQIAEYESELEVKYVITQIRYQNVTNLKLLKDMAKGAGSVFLSSSEGGTIFGKRDINDLPYFNDAWSGESIFVDRYRESFRVKDARLSIGIMVQRKPLERFMRRGDEEPQASGFMARFLITEPESTIGFRNDNLSAEQIAVNEKYITAYNNRVYDLLSAASSRGDKPRSVITLSAAAAKAWQDYQSKVETLMGPGKILSTITDFGSKIGNNICRIAAILDYFEGKSESVSLETMQLAIDIGNNYLLEYKRLFGAYNEIEQLELDAYMIHEWLYKRYMEDPARKYTLSQLRQLINPKYIRNIARLRAAFELLISRGVARFEIRNDNQQYLKLVPDGFGPDAPPKKPGPSPVQRLAEPNWNQLLGLPSIHVISSGH